MRRTLWAEAIGSFLLFATVIGSGIMAEKLAGGNVAIALLGNTIATGAMLYMLLTMLGRWMRMFTIPNQSSAARAYEEFDEAGPMKPSAYDDLIVDVVEELVRFIVLLRPPVDQLVDRNSERVERGCPVKTHVEKAGMPT